MVNSAASQVFQGSLERVVRKLFPNHSISVNARKEASIKYERGYLELDIWIPEIQLGFEFQDSYHYFSTWHSNLPKGLLNFRDVEKREVLLRREETLIHVPFWWDNSSMSLISQIKFQRPDLLTDYPSRAAIIPLNCPLVLTGVPGVGELMLASFTNHFPATISQEHPWWVGEKYDGTRICWSPQKRTLYSRYGFQLELPQSLLFCFPRIFLDGEIWFGRGNFQETQRMFASSLAFIEWTPCRAIIFDAPGFRNQHLPFEERYAVVLKSISPTNPFVVVATRILCVDPQVLRATAERIISEGAEGLIVRKKGSKYESGRSEDLLKIKSGREDREALVVDVSVGTFLLQLPNNSTFQVFRANIKSDVYPKKGDIVTFLCESYSTKGIPVNPQVSRIRKDVTWESILQDYSENPEASESSEKSEMRSSTTPGVSKSFSYEHGKPGAGKKKKTYQLLLRNKKTAARKLLEEWAEKLKFDPLVAENWYKMPVQVFKKQKGGAAIYASYNNNMIRALADLFPEVHFQPSKFDVARDQWRTVDSRRKFFIAYAKKKGFDPFVASNWYSLTLEHLRPIKGSRTILDFYGGSAKKAIKHVFPELNIQLDQFPTAPHNYWLEKSNRRKHFEKFAKARGFDPLIAANWNEVSVADFIKFAKGSARALRMEGNIPKAIKNLFPEIQHSADAKTQPKSLWGRTENRRNAFLGLAATLGFDPKIAENWYTVPRNDFLAANMYGMLSQYYGKSPYKALMALFPELDFDPSKFYKFAKKESKAENIVTRKFFEDYASANKFDPLVPENWYSFTDRVFKEIHPIRNTKLDVGDLFSSFPEMEIDDFKFTSFYDEMWQTKQSRRQTLERFARRMEFSPFQTKNWLNASVISLVSPLISRFYSSNMVDALHDLFPETYRGKPVPRKSKSGRTRRRKPKSHEL
eukprot:Phypoly_transcript_01933.p1 GENE.Phypoly_transcript_01933~~Phypoly_transcript_01933.p1  ORF type:complete len:924 (+),score=109.23 Phypoly_transcript_01933:169-2940(+)